MPAPPPTSPTRRSRSRIAQRDRAAEAVVSDAQGSVEGRAPDQPRWSPRAAEDVLVEFERVRTLSGSTAQVTFRDLSRLRLNPNSNAIIQRMRSDPLTGGEVTKVSLVNGDFYALLNQLGDRTAFEVAVPGRRDRRPSRPTSGSSTRRANRASPTTTPPRSRSAAAARRSASARTRAPWCPTPAPPSAPGCWRGPSSPRPSTAPRSTTRPSPSPGSPPRAPRATGWRWRPTPTSTSCRPPSGACATPAAASTALAPGDHYWRVSSLDRLGLPGVRSLSWRFRIVDDVTPPFVTLARAEGGRDRHHRRGGGRRRERARRAGDGQRRLRAGRRQRRASRPPSPPPRAATPSASPRSTAPATAPSAPAPSPTGPRRRSASRSTRRRRGTPTGRLLSASARSPSPASRAPTPGRGCACWRRTGRWRCRRWSTPAAPSTSPCRPARPGRPTALEIVGPDGTVEGQLRARRASRTPCRPRSCSTRRRRRRPPTPGSTSPARRRAR